MAVERLARWESRVSRAARRSHPPGPSAPLPSLSTCMPSPSGKVSQALTIVKLAAAGAAAPPAAGAATPRTLRIVVAHARLPVAAAASPRGLGGGGAARCGSTLHTAMRPPLSPMAQAMRVPEGSNVATEACGGELPLPLPPPPPAAAAAGGEAAGEASRETPALPPQPSNQAGVPTGGGGRNTLCRVRVRRERRKRTPLALVMSMVCVGRKKS